MKSQFSSNNTKILNVLFSSALIGSLMVWISSQGGWLLPGKLLGSYGVSEWLVNYQGGFVRRGLPGELIFLLGKYTGIDVAWTVFWLCLGLYGLYFYLVLRASHRLFPMWGLCSAPLLGYPVYSGELVRKDVLLLLLFFLIIKIVVSPKIAFPRQVLIGALSSVAILSHELFLFFGLPISILADVYRFSSRRSGYLGLPSRFALLATAWVFPLLLGGLVLYSRGSEAQAVKILQSWAQIAPIADRLQQTPLMLPGALGWLGKSPRDAVVATQNLLSETHLGVPFWVLVILALLLAALVVTVLFNSVGDSRAFVVYFIIQLALMMPIYLSALDQGRWIFFTMNSAFILATLLPLPRLGLHLHPVGESVRGLRAFLPPAFCVVVLAIWGFPHYGWSLQGWLYGSPLFSAAGHTYFYLRVNNLVPPLI